MPKIPEGFTCECGQYHDFGVYVAAHSRDRLVHTCNKCGAKHSVCMYQVRLIKKSASKKK